MHFEPKYKMSLEDNIFWAKRNIVDSIWKEAMLEGIDITFPDTNEIYEGRTAAGLSVKDTVLINNLKHAWEFILENPDLEINLNTIRQINQLIGAGFAIRDAGSLRHTTVYIGGTDWTPDIPYADVVDKTIEKINTTTNPVDKALTAATEIMRGQWFYDGNKRTAQILANLILIQNGCGIFVIHQNDKKEFLKLLTKFYESNEPDNVKEFLYEHSIKGVNFDVSEKQTVKLAERDHSLSLDDMQRDCDELNAANSTHIAPQSHAKGIR